MKKLTIEAKGLVAGGLSSIAVLGLAFGLASIQRRGSYQLSTVQTPIEVRTTVATGSSSGGAMIVSGKRLFSSYCANCHGTLAQGEFGPDLRGINKSESEIAAIIMKGFPGRMPAVGRKLTASEVQATATYVTSLTK